MAQLKFSSLAEALPLIGKLEEGSRPAGGWNLSQVFRHLGQSIAFSMDGFPRLKPALFRATIGRLAKARFLRAGTMNHTLDAPIPGAPELRADEPLAQARAYLIEQIKRLQGHSGPLQPHFAYGPLSRPELEQLQAMHIANHLQAFQ